MQDADFQAAIQGTVEQRDVQAREVSNGYVLTGNRRFCEPGTGSSRFGVTMEGVAADRTSVAVAIVNFLGTGSFDTPTAPTEELSALSSAVATAVKG